MHISKLTLNNFKGFVSKHEFEFDKGLNFFVGDNNCGKTTIFRAVEFIQSGGSKESVITKGKESEEVLVEIEIRGSELKDFISESEDSNIKKYGPAIIDNEDNTYSIRIRRSSEEDIKKVYVYIPEENDYKNKSGFDKAIKVLFDSQFVYSDLNNEDYQDFGKTKLIGRLIEGAIKEFENDPLWDDLKKAHEKAFGEGGLKSLLLNIQNNISSVLEEQYGEGKLNINFEIPAMDSFSKAGSLELEDSGGVTNISEKGTGMQRALALSLIQIYSSINSDSREKPFFFFVDEPETFLHPKAQDRFLEALRKLTEKSQIFITTHSPYLLKRFNKNKDQIMIFGKVNGRNKCIDNSVTLDLFGNYSPSWGEINYFAFGVVSVEFHNELYGFLQSKAIDENKKNYEEKGFNKWLKNKGFNPDKEYIQKDENGKHKEPRNVPLPTYIRNLIHHPENEHNKKYSYEELKESTEQLIKILRELPKEDNQTAVNSTT